MSTIFELDTNPHRRLNILTGEWVLVSPHWSKRLNEGEHNEWHWHMHFYPPLLRSSNVKKSW